MNDLGLHHCRGCDRLTYYPDYCEKCGEYVYYRLPDSKIDPFTIATWIGAGLLFALLMWGIIAL